MRAKSHPEVINIRISIRRSPPIKDPLNIITHNILSAEQRAHEYNGIKNNSRISEIRSRSGARAIQIREFHRKVASATNETQISP